MAPCAGVQKVSRPMLSCHEMSQMTPTAMLLKANAMSRLVQKPESGARGDCAGAGADSTGAGGAMASAALAVGFMTLRYIASVRVAVEGEILFISVERPLREL